MTGPHPKTVWRLGRIRTLRARGWEQWRIAKDLGLSQPEVCRLIKVYMKNPTVPIIASLGTVEEIYDRWVNIHDIRSMGERAVRETA